MARSQDLLFSKVGFHQVTAAYERQIVEAIDELDQKTFAATDMEGLLAGIESSYRMDVPRLSEQAIRSEVTDVTVSGVDAWGDPFRGPGVRIEFFVPFEGNPEFFSWTPSSFSFNRPQGVLVGHELRLTYQRTDHDAEATREQFDADLATVRSYLATWSNDAGAFNASLRSVIARHVEVRRQKLSKDQEFAKKLGFPPNRNDN